MTRTISQLLQPNDFPEQREDDLELSNDDQDAIKEVSDVRLQPTLLLPWR